MNVVIEGTHLPGRTCHPNAEGYGYTNVHVGLCVRGKTPHIDVPGRPWGVVGVVAGDAPSARWEFDVEVRGTDFGGPYVRGARGDRHIFLAWGEMAPHGPFELFRGSKLRLDAIDRRGTSRRRPSWAPPRRPDAFDRRQRQPVGDRRPLVCGTGTQLTVPHRADARG